MTPLADITSFLDEELRTASFTDSPRAQNGLQLDNDGGISRVAVAVDGTQRTIEAAIEAGADLLILHHGIFWSGQLPVTGWWKRKLETALRANLAIYAAHLPLDMHPELGNNACLARELGLAMRAPETDRHGNPVGMAGNFDGTPGELKAACERLLGGPVAAVLAGPPNEPVGRMAICSGDAAGDIYDVFARGYRTYLTGEICHWAIGAAEDLGMNLLFGGHYATETFGVRQLGALLERRFGLPWTFIHEPTHA